MLDIDCLICGESLNYKRHPIFLTISEHSKTVLHELITQVLYLNLDEDTLSDEAKENICVCESCLGKINNYDLGVTLARKAQKELEKLVEEKTKRESIKEEKPESSFENNQQIDEEPFLLDVSEQEAEVKIEEKDDQLVEDDPDENDDIEEHLVEYLEADVEQVEESPEENESNSAYIVEMIEDGIDEQNESDEIETVSESPVNIKLPRMKKFKGSSENEERWFCDVCGASYKTKAALQIHVGMHNGLSPFECPECHKRFTQKSALGRHMPLHTGEKPYQCDVCGKRFIHYSSFHMHQLAHNNIRDKKCDICGLELRSGSHLKRHMRVHTGEKPYACPQCGQKFAQRYNMNAHFKAHQGIRRSASIKSTECPVCKDPIKGRGKLREHLSEKHGQVIAVVEHHEGEADEGDGWVIIKEDVSTRLPDGTKVEGVALLS